MLETKKKWSISLIFLFFVVLCIAYQYNRMKNREHFTTEDVMNKIDVIYYINLDHREDRKEAFLKQMRDYGFPDDKIVRISAIYIKEHGDLGCSMSHIKTMETFMKSPHTNCIVFEDDFEFTQSEEKVHEAFFFLFSNDIDYDVCMLSGNELITNKTDYTPLRHAINVQTTSGYMVHKKFSSKLHSNFKEGATLLQESIKRGLSRCGLYCIDMYWKKLQKNSNWYIFYPKLGKQADSFSNIINENVQYDL
jgi:hypothetical protein